MMPSSAAPAAEPLHAARPLEAVLHVERGDGDGGAPRWSNRSTRRRGARWGPALADDLDVAADDRGVRDGGGRADGMRVGVEADERRRAALRPLIFSAP